MRKTILTLLILCMLAMPVQAAHNRFDHRVDLNNINWFDRGLYFGALPYQNCIDLNEFYAYADSDPFDRWDRDDAERYLNKLDYFDARRIASNNRFDNIDHDEFDKVSDLKCSTKRAFDVQARQNRFDNRDNDDFYEYIGYPNQQQYRTRTRHFPYERGFHSGYQRVDKNGGIASWYAFR